MILIFSEKIVQNILRNNSGIISIEDFEYLNFYQMIIEGQEEIISHFLKKIKKPSIQEEEFPSNSEPDIYLYIKLIFLAILNQSSTTTLCISFILFKQIAYETKNYLINFFIMNRQRYAYIFIQKYIIFIQTSYKVFKLDMMEILNLLIGGGIETEEITKLKSAGIVPLILTYANNCEIDNPEFFNFIAKFSNKNTMTVVDLLEKLNINLDINSLSIEKIGINSNKEKIIELKSNLFSFLNFLSLKVLKLNKDYFEIDEILYSISIMPLIKRNKKNINEIIKFLTLVTKDISLNILKEETVRLLLTTLMSLLYLKKSVRSAFIYSTCLFNSIAFNYLPNDNLLEFIHNCYTCDIKICFVCVHRCHNDHSTGPMGYSVYKCECKSNKNCQALDGLDFPNHIKRSYPSLKDKENKSRYEDKVNIPSISLTEKSEEKATELIKYNKSNIFISTDCNILTIKSESPICKVAEISNDNEIDFEIFNEETLYYFEVEVVIGGYYDQIAIGVTTNDNYPINEFAGYLENSIGYHGDDGKCFVNSIPFTYGNKFGSNDVIGCGVTTHGNVYFTHNGSLLPLVDIKFKGAIFSIISLRGKYCSVKFNLSQSNLELNSQSFKYHKQRFYKNPEYFINDSLSVSNSIISNEEFVKIIQSWISKYENIDDISKMFQRFSLTMCSTSEIRKSKSLNESYLDELKKPKIFDKLDFETNEIQINPDIKCNITNSNEIRNANLNVLFKNKEENIIDNLSKYPHVIQKINKKDQDICKCGNGKCIIF